MSRCHTKVAQITTLGTRAAGQLTHPPLASARRRCAGGNGLLDQLDSTCVHDVAHLEIAVTPVALEPATTSGRRLGERGPQLFHALSGGSDGQQVGLGEVAVVVSIRLHPTGRGDTGVLLPVPGLLHDGGSTVQHCRVTGDLVADGPLDRPQGVDVLGLGAGPQVDLILVLSVGGLGPKGEVRVTAQGPLLHPDIADTKRLEEVTQRRDVGPGHLGSPIACAHNGFGHDLDQRDASPVVVDQAVVRAVDTSGGTADVQRLAGVLLHVGALDVDPEV